MEKDLQKINKNFIFGKIKMAESQTGQGFTPSLLYNTPQ